MEIQHKDNKNHVELMMEKVTKATQTILAIGVTIASFVFFFMFLFMDFPNSSTKDMLFVIIGYISANMQQVVSYYFGSSKSSEDKGKTIYNVSNKSETKP